MTTWFLTKNGWSLVTPYKAQMELIRACLVAKGLPQTTVRLELAAREEEFTCEAWAFTKSPGTTGFGRGATPEAALEVLHAWAIDLYHVWTPETVARTLGIEP